MEFYLFIELIEKYARTLLNTTFLVTYAGENIKSLLLERFTKSTTIMQKWTSITSFIDNPELSNKLLRKIFIRWINIRAYSFVKVWMKRRKLQDFRKGQHVEEHGEPAMRKTLKRKNKPIGQTP